MNGLIIYFAGMLIISFIFRDDIQEYPVRSAVAIALWPVVWVALFFLLLFAVLIAGTQE